MCVNDIITTGAQPLFFLDYMVWGKLDVDMAEQLIRGIAEGCSQSGCALLGGETAEHPGMYPDGEYDMAGFAVGVVSKPKMLGPARVKDGDALIAVASSGIHSNGMSLARRVFEGAMGLSMQDRVEELGDTVGNVLLTPTRIYAKTMQLLGEKLGENLRAACHVTGGGIVDNLPRVLPKGAVAHFSLDYELPALFRVLQAGGPVSEEEMRRTFNLGVGLILVVDPASIDTALSAAAQAGDEAWVAGKVRVAGDAEAYVEFE
jgi:phosphoribosylformylglycinamidine cyclo-ligase